MKIDYKQSSDFVPAPEFNGVAKIVDVTELFETKGEYGTKDQFRVVYELPEKNDDGKNWTVRSKPYTPSLHEKAGLRQMLEKINGRPFTKDELQIGFETEDLIGRYVHIIVEHVKSDDGTKTFANVTFIGKAKENGSWTSDYVRLRDRSDKKTDVTKKFFNDKSKK